MGVYLSWHVQDMHQTRQRTVPDRGIQDGPPTEHVKVLCGGDFAGVVRRRGAGALMGPDRHGRQNEGRSLSLMGRSRSCAGAHHRGKVEARISTGRSEARAPCPAEAQAGARDRAGRSVRATLAAVCPARQALPSSPSTGRPSSQETPPLRGWAKLRPRASRRQARAQTTPASRIHFLLFCATAVARRRIPALAYGAQQGAIDADHGTERRQHPRA